MGSGLAAGSAALSGVVDFDELVAFDVVEGAGFRGDWASVVDAGVPTESSFGAVEVVAERAAGVSAGVSGASSTATERSASAAGSNPGNVMPSFWPMIGPTSTYSTASTRTAKAAPIERGRREDEC